MSKPLVNDISQIDPELFDQIYQAGVIGHHTKLSKAAQIFFKAADVAKWAEIKKSKSYKEQKFIYRDPDTGEVKIANTWKAYCPAVLGVPHQTADEAIKNIEILGQDLFEAAQGIGVNRATLRLARKFEPEQLEHIKEEVSKAKTQKEKVELLQNHAEELQRQLNEQKDNAEQAHKTLEAKIEEESGLKEKWKAKFRLEQDKKNRPLQPRLDTPCGAHSLPVWSCLRARPNRPQWLLWFDCGCE